MFNQDGLDQLQKTGKIRTVSILPTEVQNLIQSARIHGQSVVLVTGVFDLFHHEHQNFLDKAKQAGEVLIVGLESDKRVRELKGDGRPVWNQEKRLKVIIDYLAVDGAFILPEDFDKFEQREALMAELRPDILAVSSHSPHLDKKQLLVEKYGGKLEIVHQHNPEVSTSKLLSQSS